MKRKGNAFSKLKPTFLLVASALALLGSAAALTFMTGSLLPLPVALGFLLAELVLLWILGSAANRRRAAREEQLNILGGVTLDFLMDLALPCLILGVKGEILWYNRAFQGLFSVQEHLYEKNVNDVSETKISLRRLLDESEEDLKGRPVTGSIGGRQFEILPYRIVTGDKTCLVTVWQSIDRILELKEELAKRNAVVAYAAVDNYSEIAGISQGNYRTVTAKIAILLKEWANGMGAVLQEMESDRFILLMEEQHLLACAARKFDILDQVRELSRDNGETPVTVSIGIAAIDGSMREKEDVAFQALDLALQRGGDQAVIKRRDNVTEYYGGRTKTVQKRDKIRSRIVASGIVSALKEASGVLIMGHRFADHDSIGSCVGMARFAMEYCDRVNVVVNEGDPNLKGVFRKLADLPEYDNVFIDGAAAQDLISSSTLLIVTDVNNIRQFEAPELYENIRDVIIIDHHRQAAEFPNKPVITYIEPSASSASELVSEMLELVLPQGKLLKEEAELLFAGMILDTKQFANNTGPRTFAAALYLRSCGANPAEAQMLFRSDLEDFKREVKFESNAFIYRDVIVFSFLEDDATQEDKIAASKAADRLLGLEGVLASFVLCRIGNTVYISARSGGKLNVQLITERLNGGGHFDMAGAQLKDTDIKDAFVQLKEVIDQYLNEE